ncbi:hypothetical protein DUNSADRAFT_17343 [Dunaliella salina]|uniref:Encoded protein n=1 Tax=Dunaliella salina TaxID=3046 RepID=A0ABQ7H066_DUNSA|nr:hypothetical protein DUNSADRAFT_17343 [Dunaliella salina]|eukprot:KAF5840240.1 hypothetical protein DUNSADRAFT_17343 [Dunaliella salina]
MASSLAKQIYAATGGLPKVSATAGSGSGSKATALAVSCLTDIVAITLSDAAHSPTLAAAGTSNAPEWHM